MTRNLRCLSIALWAIFLGHSCEQRLQAQSPLATLKPLKKVHYPWGLPHAWLRTPDDDLRNVLRICGSATIQVQYQSADIVQRTADLARELQIPLCVQFSPWERGRVPDGSPRYLCREILFFLERCEAIQATGVRVAAVSFDDERYDLGTTEAMLPWRTALYQVARCCFPEASIDWYGHGSVRPAATDTGWSEPAWQLGESLPTDYLATALYRPGELPTQRETVRRSAAVAQAHGKRLVVYLALGAGYKPTWDAFHVWVDQWNYDPLLDRMLGRELNGIDWYAKRPERYAPYDQVAYVILYPPPSKGAWLEHFTAYAEGSQR